MSFMDLIGNVAFPIVACLAMAWYVKYITDKNYEQTKELNEKHSIEVDNLNKHHTEEMSSFKDEIKEALNNNTRAIDKLCEEIIKKGGI